MISVLLPSRNRIRLLDRSVWSLRNSASSAKSFEVLVAADEDDDPTAEEARVLGCTVIRTERFGWSGMHHYMNALADIAQGEWLMLWNDDAVMQSTGWDQVIHRSPPGVLHMNTNHIPELNVFPVVSTKIIRAMGHFSLSPHCDSWVFDAATEAGCVVRIDVDALHDRFDMTGNNDDSVYRHSQSSYQSSAYYQMVNKGLVSRDAQIMREVVASWSAQ